MACCSEASVHFIRRDVEKAFAFHDLLRFLAPGFEGGFQKVLGPQDICLDEEARILDRAVHMGFGGEMDDAINGHGIKEICHQLSVADIPFDELDGIPDFLNEGGVAGIGQIIEKNDAYGAGFLFDQGFYVIGADKSGSAGYKVGFHSGVLSYGFRKHHQIATVFRAKHGTSQFTQRIRVNEAHAPGDFLDAGDVKTLPALNRLNEIGGVQKALVGSRIKPGGTPAEEFQVEVFIEKIFLIYGGDFKFSSLLFLC